MTSIVEHEYKKTCQKQLQRHELAIQLELLKENLRGIQQQIIAKKAVDAQNCRILIALLF